MSFITLSFYSRNGLIFFPDFCQLVLERLREDRYAEEDFRRFMFKVGEDRMEDIVTKHLCYRCCVVLILTPMTSGQRNIK